MRLTETDASFIYMESASGPMHISSVYVVDGELPFSKLMTRFEKRIHLIPAFRRKLMQVPFSAAHPVWVDDPDFDLTNHVQLHSLPQGTSLEDGVDKAVELNEPMLDRDKPLWKTIMLEGVQGKTLILQMTHHALIDGASGVELTMLIYDLDKNAGEPVPPNEPWEPAAPPSAAELLQDAVQENIRSFAEKNPVQLMTGAANNLRQLGKAGEVMAKFAAQPAITAPFNAGLVGPKRRVGWLKKDFAEIREIRRHLGGTINDVVLTVVSEAVARYLELNKERTDGQYMRIMCPVNIRTEDGKGALGNQVSAIFPRLPATPINPLERLHTVIAETERIKREEEAQAMTIMQESMPHIPPLAMAATQMVGTQFDPTAFAARNPAPPLPKLPGGYRPPNPGYNFTCTNVPGVQVPQYLCGLEVTDTIGLLVLNGNVGFSITILSYNRQLFFNFICEPRLLPDLESIVSAADDVFGELLSAAQIKAGS